MAKIVMVAWDMHPFRVRGGSAYAVRRLSDQLVALGTDTRVLLPDLLDREIGVASNPPFHTNTVPISDKARAAPWIDQANCFATSATRAIEALEASEALDAIVTHESAFFVRARNSSRRRPPLVLWLHSLYDPPVGFQGEHPGPDRNSSLLASALSSADIVAVSAGVLKDAADFDWPPPMRDLQQALLFANAGGRVLIVESTGCLGDDPAPRPKDGAVPPRDLPDGQFVFFPGRPTVDKGFPFFLEIAERLHFFGISSVAVCPPTSKECPSSHLSPALVHWLPWLGAHELTAVMRKAACVLLPSTTEGFGLAGAESVRCGATTLYHEVGGHHALRGPPNAIPVPLTPAERAGLYHIWSDLLRDGPNSWPVWQRHAHSFGPVIERWVDAVRANLSAYAPVHRPHYASDNNWGQCLMNRLAAGRE